MTEETYSSSAATEYFAHVVEVMRENEKFIRGNAKETYDEVIELINDAIDEVGFSVKKPEREKDYLEYSTTFFTYHILMPFSYAIYSDLLTGNVPACFMELRLMLESLVKCCMADSRHPKVPSCGSRLKLLEQEMRETRMSISKAMKELGEKLGVTDGFDALWRELSQDWVHTEGFTDKLVKHATEKSDMPPWALAIPMNYTESDLNILEELRGRISRFRSLLSITMEKSRQECGSDTG